MLYSSHLSYNVVLSLPFESKLSTISRYKADVSDSLGFIRIYHILGSDYAEFARRDIGDVTITHISTPCKKCISISPRVQKMHISDVTMEKYVTTNKSVVKYLRIFIFIYYGNFSLIVYKIAKLTMCKTQS
jgi:hypothetical protein